MTYILLFILAFLLAFVFFREFKRKKLGTDYNSFKKELTKLKSEREKYQQDIKAKQETVHLLSVRQEEISKGIKNLKENAENSANIVYEQAYSLMQEKLERAAERASKEYQEQTEQHIKDFQIIVEEMTSNYNENREQMRLDLNGIEALLNEKQSSYQALVEEEKRRASTEDAKKYFCLELSDQDKEEVQYLLNIIPHFREARPIYKIIWESYYRNPARDMINRVIGTETKTGIYKITNLNNNYVYIGQAVDIGDRFVQHIKAGIGLDAPANKLYSAMQKYRVENFMFELLEECTREELNSKESYWISFYNSTDTGYNMTKGNSK